MWKCPVCSSENKTLRCRTCGFDGSCDYERYPSLSPLPCGVDSVARRREVHLSQTRSKPSRGRLERWTLVLGMVCIPMHLAAFLAAPYSPGLTLILCALQVFMQLRLRRRGASCGPLVKRVWFLFDRAMDMPAASGQGIRSILSAIPQIFSSSFLAGLSFMLVKFPVYSLVVFGYLNIFVPGPDLGVEGFVPLLFLVWWKLIALYFAMWTHCHILAMKK